MRHRAIKWRCCRGEAETSRRFHKRPFLSQCPVMWGLLLTLGLIFAGSDASVTCRDNNNGPVDWYILYKAPKTSRLTGLEYIYITSNVVTAMSRSVSNFKAINHPQGALANTLKPLFMPIRSMPSNFGFISYNDYPPGCQAAKTFGHSKGVLMVDRTDSGVWLLHSTPQFPYKRNKDTFWPKTGGRNGQIFICVTFPYPEFKKIGNHLQYIKAFPFEHDIPEQFHDELKRAANRDVLSVNHPVQNLQSKANMNFMSIAKQISSTSVAEDIYVTIGRLIKSNVIVQTWGCQADYASSSCITSPPQAFNLKVLNVQTIRTSLDEWAYTKDHSKWCVAENLNSHLVCIADMNRSPSQYQRRGGALCLNNQIVKNAFRGFAAAIEQCNTPTTRDTMDCDPVDD